RRRRAEGAADEDRAAPRLILTTGGTAGSAADALHPALGRLDAEMLVDGIAMRPGHPTVLARLGGSLVLGMPGNPLAGFAALLGLGRVVLDGLAGHEHPEERGLGIDRVAEELPGARRGTRLLPVVRDRTGVVPAGRDGSAMLRGLAAADALAEVPAGGAAAGSTARLHLLPWTADRGEAAWDA
ncbi:molybdopterin-binding protein, partial [Nesterenkonia sp. F]|uniref:molybdopterin-binding protein n=1 Tax=Nesterenkonia sp. F TaxID=795955 RepID=UPI000255C9CC